MAAGVSTHLPGSHNATERFVRDLNDAWIRGDYDDLADYFDPDVVMSVPGQAQPIRGARAMIDSYRQFGAAGLLHEFEIENIDVFTHGPVQVCHLDYRVDYEIDGSRYQEKGRDVYVITTDASGKKAVVWRTQQALAGPPA